MSTELSIFSSPEDRDRYYAAYDAMFDLWPVPHEPISVPTRFGNTHINVSGSSELPPMVLLHAAGWSSTAWFANIGACSQGYRTYAIDIIGDAGKSRPTRRLETWVDHAAWLKDVLDGLALERAHVVGHSQGGWMALALAIGHPQRVDRLVLLAPAASIAPFRWYVKLNILLAQRMIRTKAETMLKAASVKGFELEPAFVRMMDLVQEHCLPTTLMPTVYEDADLRSVSSPTLLLIGDQEKIYNLDRATRRARRLLPDVEIELIPNAGHMLIQEQPGVVNARVLSFLARRDSADSKEFDRLESGVST